MDFEQDRYEPLDPAVLPALYVAWLPGAGGSSGGAHAAVRERHARGERAVVAAMGALAQLAHEARAALHRADHDAFAQALDAGYDIRARIFELDPRHVALVASARRLGLSATYTGSGGAIVGIASDEDALGALKTEQVRVAKAIV
jgi:glucuronokinase